MTTEYTIVITLHLFCLLPSLILLAAARGGANRQARMFALMVALNMLGLAAEAGAWLSDGFTSASGRYVSIITNLCSFFAGYSLIGVFGEYLYASINPRVAISRRVFRFVWGCMLLGFALVIVNEFTGIYSYYDENNVYMMRDTFFIAHILPLFALLILLRVTMHYGQWLPRRQLLALRWYFVLMFFYSSIFLFIVPDLPLHFIAGTLNLTILYVYIQMDDAKERELALAESRAAVMLSQIGPHFLQNALTGIGSLCQIDPQKARRATVHFARYLRGNMDSLTNKNLIPFSEELEHVTHYLWLESMRFEEKLCVQTDVPAQDFSIPPLTLQPLVENAVRHGITKKDGGGTVTIRSEETENTWRVIVADDGVGFVSSTVPDGHRHVGIANVRNRIAALCGGSLKIDSQPGSGTTAVLEIPKNRTS
ncbi:histidine kinase [Desulfovibrio sp. OttesenSCG-928-I05]|nr:histidine kinase [Desulfovibrio sp. OttesenSCG-928-I05]